MRYLLLIILVLNTYIESFTQNYSQKIGLGLSYISLDAPDDVSFSPNIIYEKKLNKKFLIGAKLGYNLINDFDNFSKKIPERRERVMLDLELKFALIKYKNNYLKIGVGPSAWYRNDDIVTRIKFNLQDQTNVFDYTKTQTKETNLGIKYLIELDINLVKKLSILSNVCITNFGRAGGNTITNFGLLYVVK